MRILVTGSRDWPDDWPGFSIMAVALDDVARAARRLRADVTVVHGAAPGADTLADGIAASLGWLREPHKAEWDVYGKRAGFIRNQEMVDLGADKCLAFLMPCFKCADADPPHDSHGAADCASRAAKAGIPLRRYRL